MSVASTAKVREFADRNGIKMCQRTTYDQWVEASRFGKTPLGDSLDDYIFQFVPPEAADLPVIEAGMRQWKIFGQAPVLIEKGKYQIVRGSAACKRGSSETSKKQVIICARLSETRQPYSQVKKARPK